MGEKIDDIICTTFAILMMVALLGLVSGLAAMLWKFAR